MPELTKPTKVGHWTESALRVLRERYLRRDGDKLLETPEDMCWRVALAIAQAEERWGRSPEEVHHLAEQFYDLMVDHLFLPNSPTLMNAGTGNALQYSACYVLPVPDSIEGIFEAIKRAAIVHQSGGGTGFSFSRLRPRGSLVRVSGGRASGPVSFMRAFDAATETIKQGGKRRGANMGILRVDHPDILEFIECKQNGGITNFNISVAATDEFMKALANDEEYELVAPHNGEVVRRLQAREVFDRIVRAAWRTGDPGMFFVDRANRGPANPIPELVEIESTNPCGEQALPPNEACNLGSINLARFVRRKEGEWPVENPKRAINWQELGQVIRLAVRFLDDVIEVNPYPLPEIDETVKANRRIGLGVMGWADLLFELGIPYDSQEALALAEEVMGFIKRIGHDESARLAEERGPFPNWPRSIYRHDKPLRNSTVTCIAPTGTISIIANCVAGDTLVHTLEGKIPIKDLVGKQPYVYGVRAGKPTVAMAARVWLSRKNAPVWRITFDNDDTLVATEDHLVMMADGTYRPIRELQSLDPVMAFYKWVNTLGRVELGITGSRRHHYEQRIVAEMKLGRKLRRGEVVHHLDGDHFNNQPHNLAVMSHGEHAALHSNQTVVKAAKERAGKRLEEAYGEEKAAEIRRKWQEGRVPKVWNRGRRWTPEERAKIVERTREAMWRPEIRERYIQGMKRSGRLLGNHKVKSVEFAGYMDVYDMEVPDAGNFVANGVVVHNCSSGIEPVFALAFSHIVGERHLQFINPIFEQVARERGFYGEGVAEQVARYGRVRGLTDMPEDVQQVFGTAHEIAPEWHVRMQAAFQKHTDNGVSKCVAGDTLIFTEEGIRRINELYQGEVADSFRGLKLIVADNPKPVVADLFYYGGHQPVIGMETDLGLRLEGTPNHRVRTVHNGQILWRRMDEIVEGDYLVVPYGYNVFGNQHEFSKIYGAPYQPAKRTNAKSLKWPYRITADLARALGYLVSDGGFNRNSVIFTQVDEKILEDYVEIMVRRFHTEPVVRADKRRKGLKSAIVNSRDLVAFFTEYLGTGRGAENKRTPACILRSGREIQKQFIKGLTLDGYVSAQNGRFIVVGTVSWRLAEEVQAILLNLGIPSRLETQPIYYDYIHEDNRKDCVYNVVIVPSFRRAFLKRIGFAETRKQEKAWEVLKQAKAHTKPGTSYVIPGVRPLAVELARRKLAKACSKKLRGYLHSFITADAEITRATLLYLLDICQDLEGTSAWQTLNAIAQVKALYTPVTRLWRRVTEVYDLQVPETHSFITSGLISHNTVNLPNSATVEDVARAYLLAYELGCLGITVFRDRCREEQVLHVGTAMEERAEPGIAMKPRPQALHGVTYRKRTPLGTAFITVTEDEAGEPFEAFINVGKAGSDTAAVAEALGRLISLCLRILSPLSPRERVREIVGQLSGIGGRRSLGFGLNQVRSLPDAIAQVLAEHLGLVKAEVEKGQLYLPGIGDLCPECGQATLVIEEGCKKCYSCGFTEC